MGVKHCCYGVCNSDSRYAERPHMQGVHFIPFPKPKTNLEKCQIWLQACGRKYFSTENIKKDTYICSKHFVGGNGPTEQHPHPLPAAVTERKLTKALKPVQQHPWERPVVMPPTERRTVSEREQQEPGVGVPEYYFVDQAKLREVPFHIYTFDSKSEMELRSCPVVEPQLIEQSSDSEMTTIEDFLEFSMAELKYFLQNNGESVSGGRAALAERAHHVQRRKMNDGPSEPKKFKIEHEETKGDYLTILEEYGLVDPDVSSTWSVNISGLPRLDFGKIFHYILSKEAFDTDYLSEYKTRKAYQYLESICVRSIKLHAVADYIFIRGLLAPLNVRSGSFDPDKPQNVIKILTTSDGDIIVSGCTCTENLYQCCNHVIAVLLRIERLIREMDTQESRRAPPLDEIADRHVGEEEPDPVLKVTDLFKQKDSLAQSLVGKIPRPTVDEKRKFMEQICKTLPNCLFAQMFRSSVEATSKLTMKKADVGQTVDGVNNENTVEERVVPVAISSGNIESVATDPAPLT